VYFVGVAIIGIWVIAPFACAVIAAWKGAHPVIWFTAGVVLGPVGLLYALWRLAWADDEQDAAPPGG
jgi:hypothetical protein